MPANVENMMYVREKPWHGLGTMVTDAPTSTDAIYKYPFGYLYYDSQVLTGLYGRSLCSTHAEG